jgi:hypothetical protein
VIKDYLNCGVIEKVSTRPNAVNLVVYSLNELVNKIIPVFENHLITEKQKDLKYFK